MVLLCKIDKILKIMKSYKDLEIYKIAYKLALEVHNMSLTLPKYEVYEQGTR